MRTSRFNWTVSIFPTPFDIASSVVQDGLTKSRVMLQNVVWLELLGSGTKKKVSVTQPYTIVSTLDS